MITIPASIQEWQNCFCGKLPTMFSIRNAFVQLMRYCFSNPDHYADLKDILGCKVYDPNGSPGSINIYAKGATDPANTDNIPGITILWKMVCSTIFQLCRIGKLHPQTFHKQQAILSVRQKYASSAKIMMPMYVVLWQTFACCL